MRLSSIAQKGLFSELFPHRFDFIYAGHCLPGDRPDWQTESRHPLSDRVLEQGSFLYGVRFGAQTSYLLLDIDVSSPYHPQQCPQAIPRMLESLESLGLVAPIVCSSSFRGGLHLYFPFSEAQSSYELAVVVATTLENAGFPLKGGQIEVFPDPKPYTTQGTRSLFNAHRLPMQDGSFLLDKDFQPTHAFKEDFVRQWEFAKQKNDVRRAVIRRKLKQVKRRSYQVSGKADKFINDLNAEVELGWTGSGETNRLLGRITMRCFIFHHVISGGSPLSGQALVNEIVAIAQKLPGYKEFCGHQNEIEHRAQEWARCIEASKYFPYGSARGKYKLKTPEQAVVSEAAEATPSWNEQQQLGARDRIRRAIASMLEIGTLPTDPTTRFRRLIDAGIGGGTLYRHRDLWHPLHFAEPVANPPEPPATTEVCQSDRALGASNWHNPPSLFTGVGGNAMPDQVFSDREPPFCPDSGSNSQNPVVEEISSLSARACAEALRAASDEALKLANQIKVQAFDQAHVDRIQRYLDSGDPILMAEAIAWKGVAQSAVSKQPETPPSVAPESIVPEGIDEGLSPPALVPPPITELAEIEVSETGDVSHLLIMIDLQVRWLGWGRERVCFELITQFGKDRRSLLTPSELAQWISYLTEIAKNRQGGSHGSP